MGLKRIIDRILLGGYDAEVKKAENQVVTRYTRGNTSVQNGRFLDSDGLNELRQRGDKASDRLSKSVRSDAA